MDKNKVSILLLLDLSAAFDTIDHSILLSRLETVFGIRSTALSWFRSYLQDRSQTVSVGNHSSTPFPLQFGVPQGSVLGPILFILYTTPLSSVITNHSINHQLFADDTQLQNSSSPASTSTLTCNLQTCTTDIKEWMNENQLKLNDEKTEAMLFSPPNLPPSFQLPSEITIGSHQIPFSEQARDLGFIFDSNLSMEKHITKICQTAYFELKRISTIRKHLTQDAVKLLVTSCVLSRLDYCNSLLMGLDNTNKSAIKPMQKVQNSAARLVLGANRRQPCTPLLKSLHWLPIAQRIQYKVGCLCFNIISGSAPSYLSDILPLHEFTPYSQKLRSFSDSRKFQENKYNRKKHGFRSFSVYGPHFWNSLPYSVRNSKDINSFKTCLKTHLFKQSF